MSPQAKGRIERLWGTFQDRLVSELRLAGAETIEEANRVLRDFLPRFDAHFGVPPSQPGAAYRPLPPDLSLESVLCFKYQRTVASDNTISFCGRCIQLLPGWERPSYAHAHVEVQERLDGSLVAAYRGQTIATSQAPAHAVILRARKGPRSGSITAKEGLIAAAKPEVPEVLRVSVDGCSHHDKALLHPPLSKPLGSVSPTRKPAPDHPWRNSLLTKSLNN